MNRNILVTGGAGYIGSHACKALRAAGYIPITYDNLVTGWAEVVGFGPFEFGDIADRSRLDEVFERWKPIAVLHFAALSQVGDSMRDPGLYWRGNVSATLTLLEAAVAAGCRFLIFSSTCATYGDYGGALLDEDTPQHPLNAYGTSKRAIENMLRDFDAAYGLRSVIFRYFNVAGADPDGEIGEFHRPETHLIPIALQVAAGERTGLQVFGNDYPTPDGTCIRDYIHVCDLVDAHLLGLKWLENGRKSRAFCLGSGSGYSVQEVIEEARRVTGCEIPVQIVPRRPGDAVRLVSGSTRAFAELGWRPKRAQLATMIEDAWRGPRRLEEENARLDRMVTNLSLGKVKENGLLSKEF